MPSRRTVKWRTRTEGAVTRRETVVRAIVLPPATTDSTTRLGPVGGGKKNGSLNAGSVGRMVVRNSGALTVTVPGRSGRLDRQASRLAPVQLACSVACPLACTT